MAELLGGSPRPMRAYDSYGVVDPVADEKDLKRSLDQGFRGIKIKGGDGDAANDERMVKGVRKLIGPDIALMIDFNQSLDPAEAISRIARLAPYDLHWVEEPVAQENLQGLAAVRRNSPTPIQAGENWWFPRGFAEAIAAGASDFIMPDLMKVGGVTGWMRVAAQAEAASIPMSSHLFAEASAHMLAVTPTAHWLEVLDLGRAILAEPVQIVDGAITARGHGLGLVVGRGRGGEIFGVICAARQTRDCLPRLSIRCRTRRRGAGTPPAAPPAVFRDQAGAGLAAGLAVHPCPHAGCLERRDPLRQEPRDHSCQHVAGAGGGEPRRRVGRDCRAAVRRRHHGVRPFEQHDGPGALGGCPHPFEF